MADKSAPDNNPIKGLASLASELFKGSAKRSSLDLSKAFNAGEAYNASLRLVMLEHEMLMLPVYEDENAEYSVICTDEKFPIKDQESLSEIDTQLAQGARTVPIPFKYDLKNLACADLYDMAEQQIAINATRAKEMKYIGAAMTNVNTMRDAFAVTSQETQAPAALKRIPGLPSLTSTSSLAPMV
jgi:hypothetical protein